MKRTTVCMIVGAILLGMISLVEAQQAPDRGKPLSKALPAEVCAALEQYVAKVDAAGSIKEPERRAEKYAEAQKGLTEVVTRKEQASLLEDALAYPKLVEQVVATDPTTKGFDELLDKRIKMRGTLLEACSNYTTTR